MYLLCGCNPNPERDCNRNPKIPRERKATHTCTIGQGLRGVVPFSGCERKGQDSTIDRGGRNKYPPHTQEHTRTFDSSAGQGGAIDREDTEEVFVLGWHFWVEGFNLLAFLKRKMALTQPNKPRTAHASVCDQLTRLYVMCPLSWWK